MTRHSEWSPSEAEAVILEARALERETRRETEALEPYEDDQVPRDRFDEDQAQYERLLTAAEAVDGVCRRMQEVRRHDRYAALAEKIASRSKSLLADIRAGNLARTGGGEPTSSDKT